MGDDIAQLPAANFPTLGGLTFAGVNGKPHNLYNENWMPLMPRLVGLFVLGLLQGALGWFMVESGLTERVEVSQYRLVAHLGLAILLYAAVVWTALDLLRRQSSPAAPPPPRRMQL